MSEPDIAVDVTCPAWSEALPEVEDLCRRVAAAALGAGACEDGPLELSLVLADDATVRDLNRTWRGQDKATNVLSFAALDDDAAPLPEGAPLLLGDVIIAFETCAREAADEGKSLDDHLSHLVVHGVLHLIGFDHQDDAEAEEMEAAILGALGIDDPYAEAAR